ncbi:MAG TPA: tripartite tricarboxylate transporter substrate binding protein [Burkholderiaceae bacterium]|jgi:tripartite-type tricarboxylate transporter receptor subunit TctC|nr:tripartite tricarboxylate transporter substrate binding protein [Burkholderiaceae bacterium]
MRRTVLGIAAAAAALAVLSPPALAQAEDNWPTKPVRIVVGFPPGGANDILARLLATKLQERFNQTFIVENKPGANAIISAEFAARQPADGHTLLVAASGAMVINPALYATLPYDPVKDFRTVALLATFPLIVTTHPDVPAKNIRELVQWVNSQPVPVNYGSGSSTFQLATELLARETGMKVNHVPYKGSAATATAVMANEVKFTVIDSPPVAAQIKAGRLNALAVTTPKRSSSFPELPTVAESGVPGFDATIWTSLVAPRGTPDSVVRRLQASIDEFFKQPDVQQRYATLGLETGSTDTAALDKRIAEETARWTKLAREANIKAN